MIGDLFDSPWKILIVAVVLIVLFGSAKLPVAARSLGKSMRILKTEVKGLHEDDTEPGSATRPWHQSEHSRPSRRSSSWHLNYPSGRSMTLAGRQLTSKGRPKGSPKPSACSSRDEPGSTPGYRHDVATFVSSGICPNLVKALASVIAER